MTVIIHIGYPKTGTSWLQKAFFPKIKNFEFIWREFIHKEVVLPHSFDFNATIVRNKFNELYKNKNVIISSEGLVGTTHNFGLNGFYTKEIADRLKAVFPDAKILFGIRNQLNIIPSSYIQYVRGGGTYNITNYIFHNKHKRINGINLFSFQYFEYHKILNYYSALFGKNNVNVYIYEKFADNIKEFSTKISDEYNFDINLENIKYDTYNKRLRKGLIWITKIINIFTNQKMLNKYYLINIPYLTPIKHKIINRLNKFSFFGKHPNDTDVLGKKNISYIKNYYKESNNILYNDYNLKDIKKYNYPL